MLTKEGCDRRYTGDDVVEIVRARAADVFPCEMG